MSQIGVMWRALAAAVALIGVFAAVPASAQQTHFPWQEVLVDGDLTFAASHDGKLGLRLQPRHYPPLNSDYYAGQRGCSGLSNGQVEWGELCTFTVTATNSSPDAIPRPVVQAQWNMGDDDQGFLNVPTPAGPNWMPGEQVDFVAPQRVFDMLPGSYVDRFRLLVDGVVVAGFDVDYEVTVRPPSAPTAGFVQTSGDALSFSWDEPYDGGSRLTGYKVWLVPYPCEPEDAFGCELFRSYWYNHDTWVLACDFAGQPERRVCDVQDVSAGAYRFVVYAISEAFPQVDLGFTEGGAPEGSRYGLWSEIVAADVGPDVFVPVDDYALAPNMLSLIHAGNYDKDLDPPVLRLYRAYFNREPDLAGTTYWLGIRRYPFTARDIAGFMAEGREFRDAFSGTTNTEYVERVYRNMLGRGYDRDGYEYWHSLLDSGRLSRAGVVFWMAQAAEFLRIYPFGQSTD